ncbi:hypothetical protein [Galactobacillus timonensis]|uniref:hypothetical protein n=1 Tax=Galactobacillus timonensis TaxID=2041840 RepID=UPI0024096CBA|nr:hypothetical protein [Galactobacillus timonensis]MDD6369606.1 hypothetical protein [Galactobacillus timonensis]
MKNTDQTIKSAVLALILLAGCGSSTAATAATASPSSATTGTQGCDIFEECADDTAAPEGEVSGSAAAASTSFKEEYESLNGTETSSGNTYRTVSIPEENPIVEITGDEAASKIQNGDTFYLYIGDEQCPWCRSVIEQALASAAEHGVDTIYYVQIWDADQNEVLRDRYELQDGKAVQTGFGTGAYTVLLKAADAFLDEYTLEDDEGNTVDTGEKRIYAPTFMKIENGTVTALTTGTSPSQTDAYQDLDDGILADEKAMFDSFFN